MYALNVTEHIDNITLKKYTVIFLKDYDNITDNCTSNEKNIDMIIPTLLLTIPCVL